MHVVRIDYINDDEYGINLHVLGVVTQQRNDLEANPFDDRNIAVHEYPTRYSN